MGDTLTITAPTFPPWLARQDHGNGTAPLAGTPGEDDEGSHLVILRVKDHAGAFAEQEFVISVSERPRWRVDLPLVFRDRRL